MDTEAITTELKSIINPADVFTSSDVLETYAHDETEDLKYFPAVVVKPETAEQIANILKFANEHKVPVTPRGGGTGLSGGALPVKGGILLSMEKFNRIIEIDEKNFQVITEPGVITQLLQDEIEKHNMFYPVDPASKGSCQIGGNVAECSGGPRAVKYGVTREYILGIEFVSPEGNIIQSGARTIKNVTGYNLTQLIVGSEGTLGIVTKICLKLIPLPKFRKVLLAAFNDTEKCIESVAEIFRSGTVPSALEFLEKDAIKAVENQLSKKFPNGDAEAQLLIEIDGNFEEVIENELQSIATVLDSYGAVDIILAEDRQKCEDIWSLRRAVGEAVKSISAYKEEDTVVPRASLPALLKEVKKICRVYGIRSICYGHAGDGNLHVNLLKGDLPNEIWERNSFKAIKEIFSHTVSLGGTISGEHGIGFSQKSFFEIAVKKEELELMKRIKKAWDPNYILNPGKIFDL